MNKTAKPDHERLSRYIEGFFARSGNTEWPTVRRAARTLGWRLARVEATCDGDPEGELFLSSHRDDPLAEHFIERYNPLPTKTHPLPTKTP